MEKMREWEWALVGSKMLLLMDAAGMPKKTKGARAFFNIACVAANMGRKGEKYSWAKLAHGYAQFTGSTQMAIWEAMRRMLRRAGFDGTVGEALAWAVMEVGAYGKD